MTYLEMERPPSLAEWLDGRQTTPALLAEYEALTRDYVNAMHGGAPDDPNVIPYRERFDLAYGQGAYETAGPFLDDTFGEVGRKVRDVAGDILPDLWQILGPVVLVGVGVLALLALGSIAKK